MSSGDGRGSSALRCAVCGVETPATQVQTGAVHSNVRRFSSESFRLWQCPACRSIHAADEVDLDYYYAHYPFHGQSMNLVTRLLYAGKLRRLEQLGMRPTDRVLDYGSGSGLFVKYLEERGYRSARGYDPYITTGPAAQPLATEYDVLLSQDVLEHVAEPREHLETLRDLTAPGGLIVLGTPNAAAVDFAALSDFVNMLHQPYHRHILSQAALQTLGEQVGLSLQAFIPGFMGSRAIPALNGRFVLRTLRANGDVLDEVLAGAVPLKLSMFSPGAVWDAFTGHWRDPGHDMNVAFRKT